jgi:predicted cupin superfamily sugar epimerase
MHPRAAELIRTLQLQAHPEGGRYRRVYTSTSTLLHNGATRPIVTAIHYLLVAGEISRWHRIDADEIWQHSEGDAIELLQFDVKGATVDRCRLGRCDGATQTVPIAAVPAGRWQAARALGDYALLVCSVAPGFDFAGFALLDDAPEAAAALAMAAPDLLAYR